MLLSFQGSLCLKIILNVTNVFVRENFVFFFGKKSISVILEKILSSLFFVICIVCMKYVSKISRLTKAVKSIRSAIAKREKKGEK
jgi:hypothetical protein